MKYGEVIHVSKWAITKRYGEKIKKYYFFNHLPKIQKEINLLRLCSNIDSQLYFDTEVMKWVAEMPYINLHPIFDIQNIDDTLTQLSCILNTWNDDFYSSFVLNDWDSSMKPYFINILSQYLYEAKEFILYLSTTKSEHFIHGDFMLSNIQEDNNHNIVVLDFENATIGPLLWDETTLVYSLIEEKKYHIAWKVFNMFQCSYMMLVTIAAIRLAQSRKKSQNEMRRYEAYNFICKYFTS